MKCEPEQKQSDSEESYKFKNLQYTFSQLQINLLVFVSGKMTTGLKDFASSKSSKANDIIMIISPTNTFLAAAPLRQISPDPRTPFITYVSRRSPLLRSRTCTFSFSIRFAASIRSSSIV